MSRPKLPRFELAELSRTGDSDEKHHKLQSKPETTVELKVALQTIWEELPQEHMNKAVANLTVVRFATIVVAR